FGVTHKGVNPGLPKREGSSEERSPRQQSQTEVGDITAITGHSQPFPKEVRNVIGMEVTQQHTITITPRINETPLTYPTASPRTRGASRRRLT
ncbi:hypothetical protein AVEN_141229-1, partial [Araneus ventricosus]